MRKMGIIMIVLAVCLTFTIPVFAWTVEEVNMNEVKVTVKESSSAQSSSARSSSAQPSSWAQKEISDAVSAGIVPDLTSNPAYTAAITREQFAELIVCMVEKAQGGELSIAGSSFTDCKNTAVLKAYGAGIVSGVGANRFDPTAKTNREQIAAMLARAVAYLEVSKDKDITPLEADLSKFTDKAQVSGWATESVGLLAANGIMAGTSSTTLSPKSPCTVEQSILLVHRMYTALQ